MSNFVRDVWRVHVIFHSVWVVLFIAGITGMYALVPINALYSSFVLGYFAQLPLELSYGLGYLVYSLTGIVSGMAAEPLNVDPVTAGIVSVVACTGALFIVSLVWIIVF